MNGWIEFILFVGVWIACIAIATRKEKSATVAIGGGFVVACVSFILVASAIGFASFVQAQNSKPPAPCDQRSDGTVASVKKYLRNNLNDPDFDGMEWSHVTQDDNGYVVRFKYRARNAFGALVIQNELFHLDGKCDVDFVTPI